MQEVCGDYEKLPFIKFHKWFFSISYRYDGCRGCWCLTEQVHVGTRWQDTGLPADLYNVRIWCCCKRGFCGQRCFTSLTDRTFMPCAASSFSLVSFITPLVLCFGISLSFGSFPNPCIILCVLDIVSASWAFEKMAGFLAESCHYHYASFQCQLLWIWDI